MKTREQAREQAQEIYDLANLIRSAVEAGIYDTAQEKLELLAHEVADLSKVLPRLHLIERNPPDYEHPEIEE